MDDLSVLLSQSGIGYHIDNLCINHVFYADDLCLMALCAIALQELINLCYEYSIGIDMNFNALKSYCIAFTPKLYKLTLPSLHINYLPISYTDSIKYLGYMFSSNNSDDNEMLRQMRRLYCRSNRLFRMFNKCSKHVLIELCRSFCTTFYCPYFWTAYKKTTFSKIRVAYNNVYRKLLGLCRRSSVSEMLAMNNISNFEALIRKSIFAFKIRLSNSDNIIIFELQSSCVITNTIWKVWKDMLYIET